MATFTLLLHIIVYAAMLLRYAMLIRRFDALIRTYAMMPLFDDYLRAMLLFAAATPLYAAFRRYADALMPPRHVATALDTALLTPPALSCCLTLLPLLSLMMLMPMLLLALPRASLTPAMPPFYAWLPHVLISRCITLRHDAMPHARHDAIVFALMLLRDACFAGR